MRGKSCDALAAEPKTIDLETRMASSNYRTTPVPSSSLPKGIPYIVGNEAAERFSFYGMKAILFAFMTKHLLDSHGSPDFMDKNEANVWVHTFVTAAYFFPIAGAVISDWLFGKYHTIISLSIVYCLGHAVLVLLDFPGLVPLEPRTVLWLGLGLIAIGSGGIKPCVSAHVGDQFGSENQHLISKVFAWFYFSINLGSTVSTLLTPVLLDRYGAGWAFGVPGALMGLATLVFWMGRREFVHIPASGNKLFSETLSPLGRRAILNLIPLYVFVAMFWALFDQTASAWINQAEHMDRELFGWELLPSQIQAANPIMVMILIPIFSYGLYPLLGRYFQVTPLRKIGMGLFLTVPAFALPAWIESRIQAGETPHINWQIAAYLIITMAEVMVSITALEFSYTQAPKKMKSFIMGLYLLSVAFGNLFTAQINSYIVAQKKKGLAILEGENYYWFFTAAMAVTACIFVVFARFYRGETFIQGEDGEAHGSETTCPVCGAPVAPGTAACPNCGEQTGEPAPKP